MAIYLKWHMCPCHEPLVAQISICPNTFGRAEYLSLSNLPCTVSAGLASYVWDSNSESINVVFPRPDSPNRIKCIILKFSNFDLFNYRFAFNLFELLEWRYHNNWTDSMEC